MNVTFNRPGDLRINPDHITEAGRSMVYVAENGDRFAGLFWLTPQQAAQWVEALTPLAGKATQ